MDDCKPWIEKYRPKNFDDIVLEKNNKILLNNIIKQNHFPNLLFYGPPGTGKTTTIINLIDSYHKKYNNNIKGLKIHLNASDDRGIDIIRNHINQFVNTKSIFGNGLKFVILDEVDYMTKNAQQALRYLIQQYSDNIRFCLICNYISKIDKSLQDEFLKICFSSLPKKEISKFLKNIISNEELHINKNQLLHVQNKFGSDIRSMINYIQSNHNNIINNNIITNNTWKSIVTKIKKIKDNNLKKKQIKNIQIEIEVFCEKNQMSTNQFIISFVKYLIDNDENVLNKDFLTLFEKLVHNRNINSSYIINFAVYNLYELYKSL